MKSNFEKISRKFGRRAHERITIPGSTVSWKALAQASFPDEALPLSDFNRFGIAFLSNTPPEVDSEISIKIHLPKPPEKMELSGKVKYSIFRGPGLTYEYRVGVQLRQFSTTEGDNSPQIQDVLEELERIYGKKQDAQDIED